jgi:large repetitive protein
MKLFKTLLLIFAAIFLTGNIYGQANAFINILTQNSGQVNIGNNVFVQVDVGNTGPVSNIGANRVRAKIDVPIAICSILPNAQQTGLPAGWTITANTGSSITVCNGSDIIAPNTQRTILIAVKGDVLGGPSTIAGNLLFSNGTSCTIPGSLAGDNTADNISQSSIQVIPASSCTLALTATAGTIACNGGTTTLTATATGASGPVEYSLTGNPPFQASNIFTVPAGTYTVTAREVNTPSCLKTSAVAITEPPVVPAPTITILQPSCSVATGTISITSPTAGFTFSIDGGAYSAYPANGYIVTPGPHTLSAQNSNGCISAVINAGINAQPVTPSAPIAGTVTQPSCAVSSGSVVLSGLPSGNWIINPGSVAGNTSSTTIMGLMEGAYMFTVTNADGCASTPSANVIINNVPGAPPAPTVNVIQPTCSTAAGIIAITSSTTGLTFSLDGGPFAEYPSGGYTIAAGSHLLQAKNSGECTSPLTNITVNPQPGTPLPPTVSVIQPTCTIATGTINITSATTGLTFSFDGGAYLAYPPAGYVSAAPGNHTLTAQNISGCISALTNIAVDVQPSPPTVTASAGVINCFGESTTLTVTAGGGTAPYQYSLNGGTLYTENIFTVPAGNYTVTVSDANLCTASSATINIIQPAAISATVSSGAFVCNADVTTFTVTANGGTGTLQYSLNNGPFQSPNTFTVGAGTYAVTIKDAALCTITTNPVTVTMPPSLTAVISAKRIIECGGTSEITVGAFGGTPPYIAGTGIFTRGPGSWAFSVKDASGCVASAAVDIEAPGCLNLKIYPNPSRNIVNVFHSAAQKSSAMQIFTLHGALVLTKVISEGAFQTTIDINRLASGNYIMVYLNGNERKSAFFSKIAE